MIGVGKPFPHDTLPGALTGLIDEFYTADKALEWVVIFFYPKDWTFICPTEISAFQKLEELEGVNVYGISPDNEYSHLAWLESNELLKSVTFTLLADSGNKLAKELEIVSNENVPYRATYIVNPGGIIEHLSINALDTGRNVDEIIRTYKALEAGGLTGCEWKEGDGFVA